MSDFSPTGRMLRARGAYRRLLARDESLSRLTLAGLAPDDEPILLRQIYVPLMLSSQRVAEDAPEERLHQDARKLPEWLHRGTNLIVQDLLFTSGYVNASPRTFLISGEAGSGKTTLVRAVTQSLAGVGSDELNRHLEGYVPIPILLREAPLDKLGSLLELVSWWLGEVQRRTADAERFEPRDLKPFLDAGRAVLILDGLDEVGTLKRRRRIMNWLTRHRWVDSRVAEASPCITLVTARPSGFEGFEPEKDLPPHASLHVAPLSREQIRTYLKRWFELRPLPPERRKETVDDLVARLTDGEEHRRLQPLARRPAYLAALAFVHGTRGALPHSRAALYELLVDAYLEALDRHRGLEEKRRRQGLPVWDRQEKLEVLAAVAYQAHVGARQREERGSSGDRRLLWSREELEKAVERGIVWGEERFRDLKREDAAVLTDYFVARTGLLVEAWEGSYQFAHLSLQEYLTALFFLNRATAERDKARALEVTLFPLLDRHGWQEVALLVLAIDAARSAGQGHRAVLGLLDLRKRGGRQLLASVLTEPELRLTAEERLGWLTNWLAYGAAAGDRDLRGYGLVQPLASYPEATGAVWRELCQGLAAGRDPRTSLLSLEPEPETEAVTISTTDEDPFRLLAGTWTMSGGRQDRTRTPWDVLRGLEAEALKEDGVLAWLLVAPILAGYIPEDAEELLPPVVDRLDLFGGGDTAKEEHLPQRVWQAMLMWIVAIPGVGPVLFRRTPLCWSLVVEELSDAALLTEPGTEVGDPLFRHRARLCALSLWIEGVACAAQLAKWWWPEMENRQPERETTQEAGRTQALGLILARAVDLLRARARARDRALAWTRTQERDLDLDLALALAVHVERAVAWDLEEALTADGRKSWDVALGPVRIAGYELTRARDRARARARALAPHWDGLLGIPRRLLDAALERLNEAQEAGGLSESSRLELIHHFFVFWSGFPAAVLLLPPQQQVNRIQAQEELSRLKDPEAATAEIEDAETRKQLQQEWQEVLGSALSPIPLLEAALELDWEELDLSLEGLVQGFLAACQPILEELGEA